MLFTDLPADEEHFLNPGWVCLECRSVYSDEVVQRRQEVQEVVVALLGEHGEHVVQHLPHRLRHTRHCQTVHNRQNLLVELLTTTTTNQ